MTKIAHIPLFETLGFVCITKLNQTFLFTESYSLLKKWSALGFPEKGSWWGVGKTDTQTTKTQHFHLLSTSSFPNHFPLISNICSLLAFCFTAVPFLLPSDPSLLWDWTQAVLWEGSSGGGFSFSQMPSESRLHGAYF